MKRKAEPRGTLVPRLLALPFVPRRMALAALPASHIIRLARQLDGVPEQGTLKQDLSTLAHNLWDHPLCNQQELDLVQRMLPNTIAVTLRFSITEQQLRAALPHITAVRCLTPHFPLQAVAKNLRHLEMPQQEIPAEAAAELFHLRTVSCRLGPEALQALLAVRPPLQQAHIVGIDGASISGSLPETLKVLSICGIQLQDALLPDGLQSLNMQCGIGDALPQLPVSLQKLTVNGGTIRQPFPPALQELSLHFSQLHSLPESCPKLHSLELMGCVNATGRVWQLAAPEQLRTLRLLEGTLLALQLTGCEASLQDLTLLQMQSWPADLNPRALTQLQNCYLDIEQGVPFSYLRALVSATKSAGRRINSLAMPRIRLEASDFSSTCVPIDADSVESHLRAVRGSGDPAMLGRAQMHLAARLLLTHQEPALYLQLEGQKAQIALAVRRSWSLIFARGSLVRPAAAGL